MRDFLPEEFVVRQVSDVAGIEITIERFGEDQVLISWWPDDFPAPMEVALNGKTAEAIGIALYTWFNQ